MATHILWEWGVFILVWEWNAKSQFFQNRVGWRLNLATWLSREFKLRANLMASLDFCPIVLQVAWLFSSLACSVRVQLLATCKPRASREIQPRVPASLHSLEYFFTLSHTLFLYDSHLNTGFLNAVLQPNFSWNKTNTWLIKFNLTTLFCRKSESSPCPTIDVIVLQKMRIISLSHHQQILLSVETLAETLAQPQPPYSLLTRTRQTRIYALHMTETHIIDLIVSCSVALQLSMQLNFILKIIFVKLFQLFNF